MESCLKQLRMTFPSTIFLIELRLVKPLIAFACVNSKLKLTKTFTGAKAAWMPSVWLWQHGRAISQTKDFCYFSSPKSKASPIQKTSD